MYMTCLVCLQQSCRAAAKNTKRGISLSRGGGGSCQAHFTTAVTGKDVFYQLFPALLQRASTNLLSTSLPTSPNLVRRGSVSSELSKFRSHSDLFGRNTKSVLWLDPMRSPPALRAAVPSMSAPLFPRLPLCSLFFPSPSIYR